jgi:hypothetical protein
MCFYRLKNLFFSYPLLLVYCYTFMEPCRIGRALLNHGAKAVPWLRPVTAAARVLFQVRSCGICSGQSDTGAGFLRVLRFPLPILIPSTAPHSSLSSGAGTIGQIVADVPSGLSLTVPKENNKQNVQVTGYILIYSRRAYVMEVLSDKTRQRIIFRILAIHNSPFFTIVIRFIS